MVGAAVPVVVAPVAVAPVKADDDKKPLTQKEIIAASLDSLNKKLLSDIAANKVILAKQADEIKIKMSKAFDDVKLKASQIVGAANPAAGAPPPVVGAAAPPAEESPPTVGDPGPADSVFGLPTIDLTKIDFSKFINPEPIDWASNVS